MKINMFARIINIDSWTWIARIINNLNTNDLFLLSRDIS